MKEEIKEILNDLQRVADRKCYPEDILDGSIAQEWIDYIEDYITNLQEEKEELKMTNLALADDITKNKIIKQEVLTECCGIPIGEIPMLKIQNDEYKQRNEKAVELLQNLLPICIMPNNTLIHGTEKAKVIEKAINILQGKSDE